MTRAPTSSVPGDPRPPNRRGPLTRVPVTVREGVLCLRPHVGAVMSAHGRATRRWGVSGRPVWFGSEHTVVRAQGRQWAAPGPPLYV
jgi:hypothetical protein